jgi:hypothetical protein
MLQIVLAIWMPSITTTARKSLASLDSWKPKANLTTMRPSRGFSLLTIILGLTHFSGHISHAQTIPDAVIERALQTPGADVSALQLVETNSPFQYGYGTYWSVRKNPWPPLPFNRLAGQDGISVYSAGPGVFLVDDRSIDYETESLAQTIFTALEMDGGGGDGGTPMYICG